MLCFSCCHRWHRIFWSRSLLDRCMLRSCLSLQVYLSVCLRLNKLVSSESFLYILIAVWSSWRRLLPSICKLFAGFMLVQVGITWNWTRTSLLRALLTFWAVLRNLQHIRLDRQATQILVTSLQITWRSGMNSTLSLMLKRLTERRFCRLDIAMCFSDITTRLTVW